MPYSLDGSLAEILQRIATIGARGVIDVIRGMEDGTLALIPQSPVPDDYQPRNRRTPEQSEITRQELLDMGGQYLANKVRCLAYPYPNAFIRTADGGRLLIREAVYEPPEGPGLRREEEWLWIDGKPKERWYCGRCNGFVGHDRVERCPHCGETFEQQYGR